MESGRQEGGEVAVVLHERLKPTDTKTAGAMEGVIALSTSAKVSELGSSVACLAPSLV